MENSKDNRNSEVGASSNGMKVLMLSTDRDIFTAGSEVQKRMIDYGRQWEELHIVVYTEASFKCQVSSVGYQVSGIRCRASSIKIAENVFVYPTNTRLKPLYLFNAYRIAKKIILDSRFQIPDSMITAQDPFETGLVGYLLKKKFEIPLEIQVHTDFLSPYFWRESLKNKVRVLLGKWLIKKADSLRVVSERIKASLLTLYPIPYTLNPIEVRPIFVDIEKIKNAPIKTDLHKKYPNYGFIILMASRLTREKNIAMAIEAIHGLIRTKTDHADTSQTSRTKADIAEISQRSPQKSAKSVLLHEDLTYKIRGILFSARKEIGLGHKEGIYQNVIEEKLKKIGLKFEREKTINVVYEDKKMGIYRPDFIIEDKVILELKSIPFIGNVEKQQALTYLRGSDYKIALLANFGSKDIQIERFIHDSPRSLLQSAKSVLLLIVGDGPEYQNLKFKIENLKLQHNVIIEPWTDDLISYYKTADLFLLTSNYEGYGRTVVEAAAAGLPVVMTDVGVAIGKVVEVGNKDQLVQALDDILRRKLKRIQ